MNNLIKCHYSYLISKTTVVILGFVLVVHLFGCIIIGKDCCDFSWQIQANLYYLESNLFFMKTTNILVVVFLYAYPFTTKQDNYSMLIITSNVSRMKYFSTKILTIALFLLSFLWVEVFIYTMIGGIYYPNVVVDYRSLLLFIRLYLLMLYYGFIALMLIQVFDNIYMSIIPFALHTIATIFNDGQEESRIIDMILPTMNTKRQLDDVHQIIFLIVVLLFVNTIIYHKRDF